MPSISDPKVAANLAFAQAQSSVSIGLRTQSIQLLRDGMYRLCEGFAAGAIDGPEFNRQQRRYQNLMLSLLAIEQLTGATVARQVALGQGSASASVGDKADEAAGNLAKANADATSAQSDFKKAQDTQSANEKTCTSDPTNAACGKASDDKSKVDTAQAALNQANENQKTAVAAMQAARAAVKADAAGAQAKFSDAPKTNGITDATARYIAEATRTIVSTTLLASFAQEECSRLWDYIEPLTPKERSLVLAFDGTKNQEQINVQSSLKTLADVCGKSQESLIQKASLFTPDYGAPIPPVLTVVCADTTVTMPAGGPAQEFRIVGGTPPYQAVVTSAFETGTRGDDATAHRLNSERSS